MNKQKETLGKGVVVLGILLAVLAVAVGSASADTEITHCNFDADISGEHYWLNTTLNCDPGQHGIIIGADNVIIDSNCSGVLIGSENADVCICDEGNPEYGDCGILNVGYDNAVIKNLEVENFCHGIVLKGSGPNPVVNNTIDSCKVHDNGNEGTDCLNHGIYLAGFAQHCTVNNSIAYNNTGEVVGGCFTGGHGIKLYKMSNYNNITHNEVYKNSVAGIYSKKGCEHNYVAYNEVYENGRFVGGATPYFGGGIRLQCKMTNHWTVENNDVTDSIGPGIFVRGNNNAIRNNEVRESKNASSCTIPGKRGIGNGFFSCGSNNEITENIFCENEAEDVYNYTGTFGDENTCDTTLNYDDEGTTGCTYCCGPDLVITDIWIESGKSKSSIDGKEIEEKELEEFMQEKGMEKEQKELKQLIDELGISMEEIDSIDDKCIWGRKVYYEIKNVGGERAGWSVSNLTVDGEFKMFDLVRPLDYKDSRVERFWFYRLPGGEHEVEVCADFLHWVSECNETNNCRIEMLGG